MEDNPSNEFPCRREGCTETVRYVPMKVPGALKGSQQAEPRSTVVYLRCGNGHVHPYEVVIAATSNG
jgi:hypothetical protein